MQAAGIVQHRAAARRDSSGRSVGESALLPQKCSFMYAFKQILLSATCLHMESQASDNVNCKMLAHIDHILRLCCVGISQQLDIQRSVLLL